MVKPPVNFRGKFCQIPRQTEIPKKLLKLAVNRGK